ncbi:MAG: enoyl-ACP reductase FabI [Rubricella sp.]
MTDLLAGKRGLVFGVANDKSIAWGIANVLHRHGAEMAFTYLGEAFEKRVRPLAESTGSTIIMDTDVQKPETLDALFDRIAEEWGRLDFVVHAIAYADKDDLSGRFMKTSRDGFMKALDVSCYSLVDIARRAHPLMSGGGSIITLSFLGSQRVTPNYNVMGVAKAALEASVRYLANDLGPDGIRVNAISPGPMRTLAGAAIGGARKVYRATEANSPMRANADLDHVGGAALYLVSDYGASTTGECLFVDGGYHAIGMFQPENL